LNSVDSPPLANRFIDLIKVLAYIGLCFITSFVCAPLLGYLYTHLPKELYFFAVSTFDCGLAMLLMFLFGRFFDKKSFLSYGFGGCTAGSAVREVLVGALVAALMVSTVMLILFLSGSYKVSSLAWSNDLITYLPFLLMAAMREEVIFRGYVLQTLQKSYGSIWAIVISSLLFGFLHLLNFDSKVSLLAQLYSCLCLSIDAGLVFAVAYFVKRRLWFPFGLHVTWNIFEGPVYGTFVSSLTLGKPLITGQLSGRTLLTGGVFGPEASLIEVGICLLLVALLWRRTELYSENKS
jgi:uncharacterized protein